METYWVFFCLFFAFICVRKSKSCRGNILWRVKFSFFFPFSKDKIWATIVISASLMFWCCVLIVGQSASVVCLFLCGAYKRDFTKKTIIGISFSTEPFLLLHEERRLRGKHAAKNWGWWYVPVETLTPTQIKSTIATLALMIHNQLSSVKCQDGRRLILQNSNNTGRSEEKIEDIEGIFF